MKSARKPVRSCSPFCIASDVVWFSALSLQYCTAASGDAHSDVVSNTTFVPGNCASSAASTGTASSTPAMVTTLGSRDAFRFGLLSYRTAPKDARAPPRKEDTFRAAVACPGSSCASQNTS